MMRKCAITLCLLLVCVATTGYTAEIGPSDVAGKPSKFCTLVKEPNPALLGHYGCVHRKLNEKTNEYTMEPIEYWLVKFGDHYGLYFYRIKDGKGKIYRGWRQWYLEGDKINSGESPQILVKDGDVYYGWKHDKLTKMTRIE